MQFESHHSEKLCGSPAPTFADLTAFAARRAAVLRCLSPPLPCTKMFVFCEEIPSRTKSPQLPSAPARHPWLCPPVIPASATVPKEASPQHRQDRQAKEQLRRAPRAGAVCELRGRIRIGKRLRRAGIVFSSSYSHTWEAAPGENHCSLLWLLEISPGAAVGAWRGGLDVDTCLLVGWELHLGCSHIHKASSMP